MAINDFEEILLPRLVATYEAGRLVPFIGSGMSRTICTDWTTFIEKLEAEAERGGASVPDTKSASEELIRRANTAVRRLKRGEAGAFGKAVRKSLLSNEEGDHGIPSQTRSLAKIWWPLVLSTNYDNCYAAAFDENFPERHLGVVGRGSEDCQRVLSSFSTPGRALLWALQGYLSDVPHSGLRSSVTPDLESQLVVGHEEYRHVTYRDLHFRRAFAEVFRQRSLLFLGSGIQESYLQELFGEVLEFYGPSSRPHYAFLEEGHVDREFMLARFQIIVVEYPKGQPVVVEQRLKRLAEEVRRPSRTPLSWSWGRVERRSEDKHDWRSVPDLEVVRGPLPNKRVEGECLAISAGGSGERFFLSPAIKSLINGWQVDTNTDKIETLVSPYVGGFAGRDVFAVRARSKDHERSLAHIYDGSVALFKYLEDHHRYSRIRMQLLATGGQDKHGVSATRWKVRTYPERFSFIQTVRAWAAWRKDAQNVDCRLVLHVMLDAVYQDIANGRIDVLELLSCVDIRFFVEVVSDTGELDRRPFQEVPGVTLGSVVRKLHLAESLWTVRVSPPPVMPDGDEEETPLALSPDRLAQTLQMLGVVPGSTVHFSRVARKK